MAKLSSVLRNNKRKKMASRDRGKRSALKKVVMDRSLPISDRFDASLKLAKLPRNGSRVRVRLRCRVTGRARGNYRKFELSRIVLRNLAAEGHVPGVVKASW